MGEAMYNNWPNFEELRQLAEESPERLEAFLHREVEALIESAPIDMQGRLRGLQFQVDCQRKIHKSPLGSCVAISKMMHESLSRLQQVLNGSLSSPVLDSEQTNNVVPFAG